MLTEVQEAVVQGLVVLVIQEAQVTHLLLVRLKEKTVVMEALILKDKLVEVEVLLLLVLVLQIVEALQVMEVQV